MAQKLPELKKHVVGATDMLRVFLDPSSAMDVEQIFDKTCRICSLQSQMLQKMEKVTSENIPFLKILYSILGREPLNDDYSKMVCTQCIGTAESAYKFKQKCEESFYYISVCLHAMKDIYSSRANGTIINWDLKKKLGMPSNNDENNIQSEKLSYDESDIHTRIATDHVIERGRSEQLSSYSTNREHNFASQKSNSNTEINFYSDKSIDSLPSSNGTYIEPENLNNIDDNNMEQLQSMQFPHYSETNAQTERSFQQFTFSNENKNETPVSANKETNVQTKKLVPPSTNSETHFGSGKLNQSSFNYEAGIPRHPINFGTQFYNEKSVTQISVFNKELYQVANSGTQPYGFFKPCQFSTNNNRSGKKEKTLGYTNNTNFHNEKSTAHILTSNKENLQPENSNAHLLAHNNKYMYDKVFKQLVPRNHESNASSIELISNEINYNLNQKSAGSMSFDSKKPYPGLINKEINSDKKKAIELLEQNKNSSNNILVLQNINLGLNTAEASIKPLSNTEIQPAAKKRKKSENNLNTAEIHGTNFEKSESNFNTHTAVKKLDDQIRNCWQPYKTSDYQANYNLNSTVKNAANKNSHAKLQTGNNSSLETIAQKSYENLNEPGCSKPTSTLNDSFNHNIAANPFELSKNATLDYNSISNFVFKAPLNVGNYELPVKKNCSMVENIANIIGNNNTANKIGDSEQSNDSEEGVEVIEEIDYSYNEQNLPETMLSLNRENLQIQRTMDIVNQQNLPTPLLNFNYQQDLNYQRSMDYMERDVISSYPNTTYSYSGETSLQPLRFTQMQITKKQLYDDARASIKKLVEAANKCQICQQHFSNVRGLKSHMKVHNLKCKFCNGIFTSRPEVLKHQKSCEWSDISY